ncbi:MAG: ABC transporter substrate-binding protein [Flavobacteriales bacterium]|nr:ABC transporter substrate-binding protein [Flavobacteriales bacterium]
MKRLAFLLIILGTVTFFACEKVDRSKSKRIAKGEVHLGGVLKFAISTTPSSLVPQGITDAVSTRIGVQLHCGLLRLDPQTLDVVPGIAESWSVDNLGTSYVFRLRTGSVFHADDCFGNGSREITAEDFLYTFNQLCKPKGGLAFETTFKGRVKGADDYRNGISDNLSGVQVIDDYTLKIELNKPDPSFLYVLAQPSTAVVSEVAINKYGDETKVGAGAFVLAQEDPDLIMVRNEEYFMQDQYGNQLPYLDSLVFNVITTKEHQLEAFFDGRLSMVSDLYLDPVRQLLEQHISDFSGKRSKYVLLKEDESAGGETYCIHRKGMEGYNHNFMGYYDYAYFQISD